MVYEAIFGLVVADALGVPVEFKERDTYTLTDMIGYGTHNQPPATWSDDSSMTLATLESISRLGQVVPEDIMENFRKWLYEAAFSPYGKVFDVGGMTSQAIWRYTKGIHFSECGGTHWTENGNGALMRILPLAFLKTETIAEKQALVEAVAGLTHNHSISHIGCTLYVLLAEQLLQGIEKQEALSWAVKQGALLYGDTEVWQLYANLAQIGKKTRTEMKSSGYVVDTLEAAVWCLLHSENYRDCVLLAVNLGEDTDTVGAVAGGLAGIVYGCGGEAGIPLEWLAQIPKKEEITRLCVQFEQIL